MHWNFSILFTMEMKRDCLRAQIYSQTWNIHGNLRTPRMSTRKTHSTHAQKYSVDTKNWRSAENLGVHPLMMKFMSPCPSEHTRRGRKYNWLNSFWNPQWIHTNTPLHNYYTKWAWCKILQWCSAVKIFKLLSKILCRHAVVKLLTVQRSPIKNKPKE